MNTNTLKNIVRTTFCVALVIASCSASSYAQNDGAYTGKFKNVLRSLGNYRYGDVSVFRMEGQLFSTVQRYLNPPPEDSTKSVEKLQKDNPDLLDDVRKAVRRSTNPEKINDELLNAGYSEADLSNRDVLNVITYEIELRYSRDNNFTAAYIVTSRYARGDGGENLTVIGLLKTRTKNPGNSVKDLRGVNPGDIITRYELTKLPPPPSSAKSYPDQMHGYLKDQVIQNNVTNVTLEVQGIDDPEMPLGPPSYGNGKLISEDDVQSYLKITNGIPVQYVGPNELTISAADGVSYRRYAPDPVPTTITTLEKDSAGNEVETQREILTYNGRLPLYGAELRYGLEAINYPSIWSERLALNAVWSAGRLGVILPTSGWASLSTSFGNARGMTSAGFGVNGSVDVPVKIIPSSGVFSFGGSYVFDDANRSDHMRFDTTDQRFFDYLVRFHASAHYTFAVVVDEFNLFRFKIGGTGYSMERWYDKDSTVNGLESRIYSKMDSKFIGGISARIEFMNTNWSTPIGGSLQYFDESLLGNVWLHLQVTENLGFRIDANFFSPVLRDPRPWENQAVFMPSLRAIYNF